MGIFLLRSGKEGDWSHHKADVRRIRFAVNINIASVQNIGERWGIRSAPSDLVF